MLTDGLLSLNPAALNQVLSKKRSGTVFIPVIGLVLIFQLHVAEEGRDLVPPTGAKLMLSGSLERGGRELAENDKRLLADCVDHVKLRFL